MDILKEFTEWKHMNSRVDMSVMDVYITQPTSLHFTENLDFKHKMDTPGKHRIQYNSTPPPLPPFVNSCIRLCISRGG